MADVPPIRIRELNRNPVRTDARFVLYWMTACRRPKWNYGLQRAVEWAKRLSQPLVVLEALRCDYPWASDRLHAFILQGMRQNSAHFERVPAFYYPYVESSKGAGKGLLEALGREASVVVTDDYPAFFLPRMLDAAAVKVNVLMEAVDSNGLLPMRAAQQVFSTAFAFRRFLQRELPTHLLDPPREDPLAGLELPLLGSPSKNCLDGVGARFSRDARRRTGFPSIPSPGSSGHCRVDPRGLADSRRRLADLFEEQAFHIPSRPQSPR